MHLRDAEFRIATHDQRKFQRSNLRPDASAPARLDSGNSAAAKLVRGAGNQSRLVPLRNDMRAGSRGGNSPLVAVLEPGAVARSSGYDRFDSRRFAGGIAFRPSFDQQWHDGNDAADVLYPIDGPGAGGHGAGRVAVFRSFEANDHGGCNPDGLRTLDDGS